MREKESSQKNPKVNQKRDHKRLNVFEKIAKQARAIEFHVMLVSNLKSLTFIRIHVEIQHANHKAVVYDVTEWLPPDAQLMFNCYHVIVNGCLATIVEGGKTKAVVEEIDDDQVTAHVAQLFEKCKTLSFFM